MTLSRYEEKRKREKRRRYSVSGSSRRSSSPREWTIPLRWRRSWRPALWRLPVWRTVPPTPPLRSGSSPGLPAPLEVPFRRRSDSDRPRGLLVERWGLDLEIAGSILAREHRSRSGWLPSHRSRRLDFQLCSEQQMVPWTGSETISWRIHHRLSTSQTTAAMATPISKIYTNLIGVNQIPLFPILRSTSDSH